MGRPNVGLLSPAEFIAVAEGLTMNQRLRRRRTIGRQTMRIRLLQSLAVAEIKLHGFKWLRGPRESPSGARTDLTSGTNEKEA